MGFVESLRGPRHSSAEGSSGGPSAPSQPGAGLELLPMEGSMLLFLLNRERERRMGEKGWKAGSGLE